MFNNFSLLWRHASRVILAVKSVNELTRHRYSTRDCLILLIFQSETAWDGLLARQV